MFYKPDEDLEFESHTAIRKHFKHTSFPPALTNKILEEVGIFPLEEEIPAFDPNVEKLRKKPRKKKGKKFVIENEIVPLTPQQIEAGLSKEKTRLLAQVYEAYLLACDSPFTHEGITLNPAVIAQLTPGKQVTKTGIKTLTDADIASIQTAFEAYMAALTDKYITLQEAIEGATDLGLIDLSSL